MPSASGSSGGPSGVAAAVQMPAAKPATPAPA